MAASFVEPRKSANDKRLYRIFKLENEMKVCCVSDPDTDKSSAAVNVNVGSLADPDEFPGLAHFCEHMLFLGTEKFPLENDYSGYLSEHAGFANAFTSSADTNYYFDVGQAYLEQALDRFCEFFYSPLFNADCTEREVNAVNAENDNNLKNDSWRTHQLDKATSNQSHAFSKFGTGNKQTLFDGPREKGLDTRKALLTFHKKYYSANLMGLCVVGRESLDELEAMVRARFSGVVNTGVSPPTFPGHPYDGACQQMLEVVPIKEVQSIKLSFPIKDQTFEYRAQPEHYISHLIGHESRGSLLSFLKAKGWVDSLWSGGASGETGGWGFFVIGMNVTDEGLRKVDDIVNIVFQYIEMLRREGPQEWVFNECAKLWTMQFRFKEKERPSNYASALAKDLRLHDFDNLLSAQYELLDFRPDLINEILSCLIPSRLRLMVSSKGFADRTGALTEKWYGTKYFQTSFSDAQLALWSNTNPDPALHLPARNIFIPSDFDINPCPEGQTTKPQMLMDRPLLRLWYKQDHKFKLPKGSIFFILTNPIAFANARGAVLTRLYADLLKDSLVEFAYDAELAGISYNCSATVYGIDFSVGGYAETVPSFASTLLSRMLSLKVSDDRFKFVKAQYKRALAGFAAASPTQQASFASQVLLQERMFTHAQLLDELEECNPDDVRQFIPILFRQGHLEGLIHGNFSSQQAIAMGKVAETLFIEMHSPRPLLQSERTRQRLLAIDCGEAAILNEDSGVHPSSCVDLFLQMGVERVDLNTRLGLFCQVINEPCFEILRTQQQLGYIVHSGVRATCGVRGVRIVVQSERPAEYVRSRVLHFLDGMGDHIRGLTDEQFANHKEAYRNKLLEIVDPKTMKSERQIIWGEIISGLYMFDRASQTMAMLDTVNHSDLLAFYETYFAPKAPKRREFWVQIHPAQNKSTAGDQDEDNAVSEAVVDGAEVASSAEIESKAPDTHVADIDEGVSGVPAITDSHDYRRKHSFFGLPESVQHEVVEFPHL